MEILNKVKGWASAITEVGVSLIALGIVLEILFNLVLAWLLHAGGVASAIVAVIFGGARLISLCDCLGLQSARTQ